MVSHGSDGAHWGSCTVYGLSSTNYRRPSDSKIGPQPHEEMIRVDAGSEGKLTKLFIEGDNAVLFELLAVGFSFKFGRSVIDKVDNGI